MSEILVDEKLNSPEGNTYHCLLSSTMSEKEPELEFYLKITSLEDDQTLTEIRALGVVRNPLMLSGTILTALGYYGLCVGFSIIGAAVKLADAGYRRSKDDAPDEPLGCHLLNGFKHVVEKKADLRGEAAKAFVTCAQKLVPIS
ncbi:hypothetical protein FJ945_29795 [Mesorhizobium sp. B2-4-9]|uniref:hypothetical protein n=1 Tax=Mesorhizobium sp. B2-4-9 TaxID=2589940 RepID=UPI001125E1F9|nr:hypothetical protein [Mesorhizobium sp. B2-4-9]TPL14812.1 hypothetical protein FJ945_29795 [Mesorhizobium sp. B2-4-9]